MTVCPRCGNEKENDKAQICHNCQSIATTRTHYYQKRSAMIGVNGGKCDWCGLTLQDVNFAHNLFSFHEIDTVKVGKFSQNLLRTSKEKKFNESALTYKARKELFQYYREGQVKLLCFKCHGKIHFFNRQWFGRDITDEDIEEMNKHPKLKLNYDIMVYIKKGEQEVKDILDKWQQERENHNA